MGDEKKDVLFYDTLDYFNKKDFNCLKRDYVEKLIHSLESRNGCDNEVIENYSFFDSYNHHLENQENFSDVKLSKLVKRIFEESKKERLPLAYKFYFKTSEEIISEVENDLGVIEYEFKDL